MRQIEITLKRPHAGQKTVLGEAKRFNCLACGRRWGKTELGVILAAKVALAGKPVAWGAPNYKYLREVFASVRRLLAPLVVEANKTENVIRLVTGGVIDFWTLEDEDAGRGRKYGRWIVDEAGLIAGLADIYQQAIRPTLTDLEGDLFMLGTPKGRNYFFEAFQNGQAGVEGWASWSMPTSTNPHIPPPEYDQARLLAEGLPERVYRQEYLAEFIDDAGGVFTMVAEAVDKGRVDATEPVPGRRYVAGVDLAQTTDWTVVSIFDTLTSRQVFLDRFQKLPWEVMEGRIVEVCKRYNASVLVDATGVGGRVFEALRSAGLVAEPFVFTSQTKPRLVEDAVAMIQRGGVRLLDEPVQTTELQAYEYEVTRTGNVRMGAPPGLHDDTVMALCLAIRAMSKPKFDVIV